MKVKVFLSVVACCAMLAMTANANAGIITTLIDHEGGAAYHTGHNGANHTGHEMLGGEFEKVSPWTFEGGAVLINNLPYRTGGGKNFRAGKNWKAWQDTGYAIKAGDKFTASYWWRPNSSSYTGGMRLYYVDGGTQHDITTFYANGDTKNWHKKTFSQSAAVAAGAVGKSLYVEFNSAGTTRFDGAYLEVEAVPEPTSIVLLLMGCLGLIGIRRRR